MRLAREAPPRGMRLSWLLVPLAAAAGLLAGLFLRRDAPRPAPFAAVATLATGPFLVDDGAGTLREAGAGEFLATGTRVRAPSGVRLVLVLRDGTELRVDRGSSLLLAGERRIELDGGRAWSRVAPGEPFRIECGDLSVAVLGTELAVERDGERADVRLFRGAAELEAGGARQALAAGEAAVWAGERLAVVPCVEPEALATAWMLELYAYSGTHQKDLAEHMDRFLSELGNRESVSVSERRLETELAGVCRVPLARYLVSDEAREEPESRRKAARVLERIADPSVALSLSEALRDQDSEVRLSAARALNRVSQGELCSDPQRSAQACDAAEIQGCEKWAEDRGGVQ